MKNRKSITAERSAMVDRLWATVIAASRAYNANPCAVTAIALFHAKAAWRAFE